METDFRTLVLSSSALTALIGTRVSWGATPQGKNYPAVTLLKISGTVDYHLQGETSGPDTALVQMDIRSTVSLAEAQGVRDVVRGVLSGYRGTVGATEFQGVFLRHERQSIDDAPGGGLIYQIQLDWDVYSRTAA